MRLLQETQMKTGWLILTVVLFVTTTYMLANSIYWIIIGYSQSPEFIIGTFILPVLIYLFSTNIAGKELRNSHKRTRSNSCQNLKELSLNLSSS